MVSEYASFEFGHGIKVSGKTLAEINRLRAMGPTHYDVETEDGKRVEKRLLQYYDQSDSITVHVICPGENKDGMCVIFVFIILTAYTIPHEYYSHTHIEVGGASFDCCIKLKM